MNKIMVGFVCAVCVMIAASFTTGILVEKALNQEETTETETEEIQELLLGVLNKTPIINVTVNIPDTTATKTNASSEEKQKKVPVEIITAKSINFVVLKLYYEAPYLHFWAESKTPREKIFIKMTEITPDAEKFDPAGFGVISDKNGMILLDNQPCIIEEGNRIRLDFYKGGQKIATTTSSPVTNGSAGFGPVCLTTSNPSHWRVRIHNKAYINWHFVFDGETNIPKPGKIKALISRINMMRREIEPRYGDRFYIMIDEHCEINPEHKHFVCLVQGHYKLTFDYNGSNCGELFGFEVERRKITNETVEYKAVHWIKNVYVSPSAIT